MMYDDDSPPEDVSFLLHDDVCYSLEVTVGFLLVYLLSVLDYQWLILVELRLYYYEARSKQELLGKRYRLIIKQLN